MGFVDIDRIQPVTLSPGVRIRAPFGQNLMLSYLEMEAGTVVPMHKHPHEQGGILLKGRLRLTIGERNEGLMGQRQIGCARCREGVLLGTAL